jgi:hypothetical protein
MPIRQGGGDPNTVWTFVLVIVVGVVAFLAKALSGETVVTPLRLVAGAVGGGLAAMSTVGVVAEFTTISSTFALALGGIAGWLGGNVLAALAATVEKRLGIDLTPGSEGNVDADR